jgi:hypothetical protein
LIWQQYQKLEFLDEEKRIDVVNTHWKRRNGKNVLNVEKLSFLIRLAQIVVIITHAKNNNGLNG